MTMTASRLPQLGALEQALEGEGPVNPLPRLEIHEKIIEANARTISDLIRAHGATLWGVGKVTRAHPAVVDALMRGGCIGYADSRLENLVKVRKRRPGIPLMLLRFPGPTTIAKTVAVTDVSLNSSVKTMRLLSREAGEQGRRHKVIVMVDLGDLREGVWPDKLTAVVTEVAKFPHLDVIGIGTNLACYGGVAPTVANMARLVRARDEASAASGLPLDVISGGNSSALDLLAAGKMPREINEFRMGESIILGRNPLDRKPSQGTRQDAVRIVGEVIEVESKPSVPDFEPGQRGQNAFGHFTEFVDRGVRRRAIVALGRQDAVVEGLYVEDHRMLVLGGNSDHVVVDVEDAPEVEVGSEISFWPNYAALLAAATSTSVRNVVL